MFSLKVMHIGHSRILRFHTLLCYFILRWNLSVSSEQMCCLYPICSNTHRAIKTCRIIFLIIPYFLIGHWHWLNQKHVNETAIVLKKIHQFWWKVVLMLIAMVYVVSHSSWQYRFIQSLRVSLSVFRFGSFVSLIRKRLKI